MTTDKKNNPNREIFVEKVTVNMGVGEAGEELEKGLKILQLVTKKKPVKTVSTFKLPTWGIRPGLPIGGKVTLRGKGALDFIDLTLKAKNNKIKKKSFSNEGVFSYGIHEYLDVPGIKYDPNLGIRGFDVCVSLKRKGYRVKQRKYNIAKVGKKHRITKDEAIEFAKEKLKIVVE
ncbi:MAG TPA: 50S ribosomal protein L5 [archaeon]|nr:50S ribosomal protein L5 [archaeon]HPV66411.1 50S ribosomal protein L5 [archaeon]